MNTLAKVVMLFFLPFSLFAKDINVYLRFDDSKLYQEIKKFNNFLDSKGVFSRYQIEPFQDHHPSHITLYLATYPEEHKEEIKMQVASFAKKKRPVQVIARHLSVTAGNYVMLDLDMGKQESGENHPVQRLSDEMVMRLTNLRDFNAKIPVWAESIPEKKKAFMNYGSPNVFFEFNPHFSLMAKNFDDPKEQARFQKEMTQLVAEYDFPDVLTESSAIGIGYVNSFGQVTEEIASYPLG
ncbi:2'-5' RNA ligase family protein [Legionella shakespearei]|uniref:Phosphonate metabolism protein n=1 Tax=Legionella shakespearei DSM 23087 TaxID=1122169 RepID=A0A0W0YQ82_9GAMM|nr:2'-5' RNA ligase family protein [Legionella shakespearei]KTD59013.1 hypothetical protein Lsha_2045 [Legionella shakespearei DSM 23087]